MRVHVVMLRNAGHDIMGIMTSHQTRTFEM